MHYILFLYYYSKPKVDLKTTVLIAVNKKKKTKHTYTLRTKPKTHDISTCESACIGRTRQREEAKKIQLII